MSARRLHGGKPVSRLFEIALLLVRLDHVVRLHQGRSLSRLSGVLRNAAWLPSRQSIEKISIFLKCPPSKALEIRSQSIKNRQSEHARVLQTLSSPNSVMTAKTKRICLRLAGSPFSNVEVFEDCSGGNSRLSCLSGMGGGIFLSYQDPCQVFKGSFERRDGRRVYF
jgi:hypothetical protein